MLPSSSAASTSSELPGLSYAHKTPQGDRLDLLDLIPYLVTVWSLAQSHHPLQGLGYDLLPLLQKFQLPITELKAKAQV